MGLGKRLRVLWGGVELDGGGCGGGACGIVVGWERRLWRWCWGWKGRDVERFDLYRLFG